MKQPRVSDFDPRSQEKPLKSPMDDFPLIQSHPSKTPTEATRTTSTGSTVVPPVRVVRDGHKRKIKTRHPFDIYEDQVEALKKFSLKDRMRGGIGSQSAMVREAIDDYISKKQSH